MRKPKLTVEMILRWADQYFAKVGRWPKVRRKSDNEKLDLTVEQILAWADSEYLRQGRWPGEPRKKRRRRSDS